MAQPSSLPPLNRHSLVSVPAEACLRTNQPSAEAVTKQDEAPALRRPRSRAHVKQLLTVTPGACTHISPLTFMTCQARALQMQNRTQRGRAACLKSHSWSWLAEGLGLKPGSASSQTRALGPTSWFQSTGRGFPTQLLPEAAAPRD